MSVRKEDENRTNENARIANLHEILLNDNWRSIIRRNENLEVLRKIFRQKKKENFNYRHLTTFLTSSLYSSQVSDSAVTDLIDKLSKDLLSSRNIFELRRLKAKRQLKRFKYCCMYEDETEKTVLKILSIFHIKEHIGDTNSGNMLKWVMNILKGETGYKLPNFVYKEAAFARAFRATKLMKNETASMKRKVQISIVENIRRSLCWWTLIALRQIMIPIKVNKEYKCFWRYGYLKFLRKEIKEFEKQYQAKKLPDNFNFKPSDLSNIMTLKCRTNGEKLRPILFRNPKEKKQDEMHWKKINSVIKWCLKMKGAERQTIKESCKVLIDFLLKKSKCPEIYAYTADIAKCFSAVKHETILRIVCQLLEKRSDIYTACGHGKTDDGYTRLFFCSSDSEENSLLALKQRMESCRVKNYELHFTSDCSSKWLYDQVFSTIKTYYYKRGESVYKLTKGVPQGHPLSSNLAFLYLSSFENDYWKNEKNDRRMVYCRYEDDYIFLTTQKDLFKKMIEPLSTGKNSHGLKLNVDKSKSSDDCQVLRWCGVKIDLRVAKIFKRKRHFPINF